MILLFFILLVLISGAVDWYLIAFFLKSTPLWRKFYIRFSIIYNILILVILAFHTSLMDSGVSHKITMSAMWFIYVFMLSFMPRLVFALVSVWGLFFRRDSARRWVRGLRSTFFILAAVLSSGLFLMMIWSATYGRTQLRVEYVDIVSARLPESFDGYRIAQFSDVHLGNLPLSSTLIDELVLRINAEDVDLVVNTGDLVNISSLELNDQWLEVFSRVHGRDGVYAVLGNHDYGWYMSDNKNMSASLSTQRLIEKQQAMGWTVLGNENRWIARGKDSIAVAGVGYPHTKSALQNYTNTDTATAYAGSDLRKAMIGVPDSVFSILLSHTPQLFDSIPSLAKVDLTMSGHVHAMQAKLKIGKWQISPAQLLFPMFSGLYLDRGRYLYINDGIGYVLYPMRIGTRPELTIYTLRSASGVKDGKGSKMRSK